MKKKKRFTRDDLELIIMATPTLIWFLLFSFLPMLGVLIAFKNFHISGGGFIDSFLKTPWVGLENFKFLFSTNEAVSYTHLFVPGSRRDGKRSAILCRTGNLRSGGCSLWLSYQFMD